jgi:hypothetical protein
MNLKNLINPKKTINNLPEKFSWQLFIILLTVSATGLFFTGLALGLDSIKKILFTYGNYPENSILSNGVAVQALFILIIMSLIIQILEVGVITFICQKILYLFKKRIKFFKLINLYLYAAIISGVIAFFKSPLMSNDKNKDIFIKLFLGKIEQTEAIVQLYTSGNYPYIFFGILSTITLYIILIYGVKILSSKTPVK